MLSRANVRRCFQAWGGGGPRARLFEELDETERTRLRREAALWSNEEPLVAVVHGADGWMLLTNQRLIRRDGGRREAVEYCDVLDVSAIVSVAERNGRAAGLAGTLELATAEGWHPLPLASDSSFVAIWNLLSLLVAEARFGLR